MGASKDKNKKMIAVLIISMALSIILCLGYYYCVFGIDSNNAWMIPTQSEQDPYASFSVYEDDVIEIKEAIVQHYNDEDWYFGSTFQRDVQLKKYDIDIYINQGSLRRDNIVVCYTREMPDLFGYKYRADVVIKNKKGYQRVGSYSEGSFERLTEKIRGDWYVYYKSDVIEFRKTTKPDFLPMTEERIIIVEEILDAVIHDYREAAEIIGDIENFKGEKFKVYIRRFKHNEETTPVIVCYPDGRECVRKYYVCFNSERAFLSIAEAPGMVGEYISNYHAEQYKKVSFEREFIL